MPPHAIPAVETSHLVKCFGANRAVDAVDLRIEKGCVYGLLGPNGAGKTTMVRIFSTLLRPDSGTVKVLGHDVLREPDVVRSRISLTGQFASVDEDLTGRENLILLARLLGFSRSEARDRCQELLATFDLEDATNRQVKNFSGGMRRRLDIAASLIQTPDLLFLDEPTTGLDPRSRNHVWDLIRQLTAAGTTIVLTTQYLFEADSLADRIAVVDHGKIIAEGTSAELKASVGSSVLHVRLTNPAQREQARAILAAELGEMVHLENDPRILTAQLVDSDRAAAALAQLPLVGISWSDFSLGQPSLDEVFFALTGHPAERPTTETPIDENLVTGDDHEPGF